MAQDDLAEAEKNYQESLAIRTALGLRGDIASSELSMAGLQLEMGQPEQAEGLARKAGEEFRAEKVGDQEALADIVATKSLLAQNRLPDAVSRLEEARQISPLDKSIVLSLDITSARLLATAGRHQEALRQLNDIVSRAKRMTLPGYEFQARLAQAEAQTSSRAFEQASNALRRLERDATQAGFKLLARRAREAKERLQNVKPESKN